MAQKKSAPQLRPAEGRKGNETRDCLPLRPLPKGSATPTKAEHGAGQTDSKANLAVPASAVSGEDMRAALLALGWAVLPLRGKVPTTPNGFKDAARDAAGAAALWRQYPGPNLGGVPPAGTYMLDVDVYKAPAQLQPLAERLLALDTPMQRTGGGGYQFLLRGTPLRQGDLRRAYGVADGIEVKAHGKGYVALPPSVHPESGKVYEWIKGPETPVADAPDWLCSHAPDAPIHPGDDTSWAHRVNVSVDAVRSALGVLDADCPYDVWIAYGQALKLEYSDDGWALWHEWSRTGKAKYAGEESCRNKWEGFNKNAATGAGLVTVRTILHDARGAGWSDPATVARAVADFEARHAGRELVTIPADQVDIESIDWLWPGRLPRRFLSVYAADSGSGKSTATAAIAAVLTRGGLWPDDDPLAPHLDPSDVLWLGVEDPLAQVTVPRLMAAGADLRRIHVVQGVKVPGAEGEELFSLQDDLTLLRQLLQRMRSEGRPVSLMVVDPVTAYLHGKRRIDAYKATELRSVLTPFAQLAADEDIAVICITHLTKDKTRGFIDSVLGSQALVALSRNVWGFARVPGEGDNSLAMFWGKGNLDRAALPTLRFHVEGAEVISKEGEIVKTSKVVWDGEDSTVTRETIYGSGTRGPIPTARNEAAAWLRERLGDGQWHDSASITDDAIAAGFSPGTLRRASEEVCERQQHKGRGRWRLVPTGR